MNPGLVEMFEYNRWANDQLIDACRAVSDEILDSQVPGVSGTVKSLLTHLVGGQQSQVLRSKGRQHEGELGRHSPFPGFDELARIADDTSLELVEIARALKGDETAVLAWQGKKFEFPVRFFLVHAAEHSVEHRTEIKVALSAFGFETPDLDGWAYAQARGYGAEV